MRNCKSYAFGFLASLVVLAMVGCHSGRGEGGGNGNELDTTRPTVTSTSSAGHAKNVPVNQRVTATFSEPMDGATFNTSTFTLTEGYNTTVAGTVTCTDTIATFTPWRSLSSGATYTARVTTNVTDLAGNSLASEAVWSFETGEGSARGPARVDLGNAGNYVILAMSTVSTTGTSAVVGDIGLSPGKGSQFTGFTHKMDASNQYCVSEIVSGRMYASDCLSPAPSNLSTAVLDMQSAYNDAVNRKSADGTDLGNGTIDRLVLTPGIYKWSSDLKVPNGVTFSGGPNDIWIVQVGKDLSVGNGAIVTLSGGAQARNIFWVVAGEAILGTTCDFKGIMLCQTQIVIRKGAVISGRALAQTTVTLDATTITAP